MKHRIESLGGQYFRQRFLILDANLMKDCASWNSVGEAGGQVIHNFNRIPSGHKLPTANGTHISGSASNQNPCH
jgi:hypothetical protein